MKDVEQAIEETLSQDSTADEVPPCYFDDRKGNRWVLELSVGVIEDVKNKAGLDLDLLIKDTKKLVTLIEESPKYLGMIIWVLCEEQAKARNIDGEGFGRLLYRDVLEKATNALYQAILSFYPRESAGRVLRKRFPELVAKIDKEIEKQATQSVNRALSNTVMN